MQVSPAKTSYPTYRGVPIEANPLVPPSAVIVHRVSRGSGGGEPVWKLVQCLEPCAVAADLARLDAGQPLKRSWTLYFLDGQAGEMPMVMALSGARELRAGV